MHLETRIVKNKKKYYLAYTYRVLDKIKKVRVFLGTDLTKEILSQKINDAETLLETKVTEIKRINDPYQTALSSLEISELKTLQSRGKIELMHLSEGDWKKFIETFTYDTNAIEGSSVTQREVENILQSDKWPDKSKEEISETKGVAEAVTFIRKTKEHISLSMLKELHWLIFKNSKSYAGKFRAKGVEVAVFNSSGEKVHQGAKSTEVVSLLNKLVKWYQENRLKYPPIVLAAIVHNQFEMIHPFEDGNGRIGRLILNNILLKHKLPPVNIELKHRAIYYSALKIYETTGNIRPIIELILKEYKNLKKMLK
ncbi:MAG: Fic family protein [Candidatus Micrarchaeota archaeon]|nr:Fic family protein [Candidatus Micrarchaeota archaeon]